MRVTTTSGRRASRAVAVAVLTLGLTPALQGQAWACTCVTTGTPPTEAQEYRGAAERAKLIYVGTVASVRHSGPNPGGTNTYTITVSEALKGSPGATGELRTADNSGICGVTLELREPILVVDVDGKGSLQSCGDLTTQQRVAQRAAIVRAALAGPEMPRTGGELPAAWALVAVAGALALRRARTTG